MMGDSGTFLPFALAPSGWYDSPCPAFALDYVRILPRSGQTTLCSPDATDSLPRTTGHGSDTVRRTARHLLHPGGDRGYRPAHCPAEGAEGIRQPFLCPADEEAAGTGRIAGADRAGQRPAECRPRTV